LFISLADNLHLLQVIMPGYCVAGTVGHKILSGQRKIELENRQTVKNYFKTFLLIFIYLSFWSSLLWHCRLGDWKEGYAACQKYCLHNAV